MYMNVTIVHVTTTIWRSDRGVLALDVAFLWIDQEIIPHKYAKKTYEVKLIYYNYLYYC